MGWVRACEEGGGIVPSDFCMGQKMRLVGWGEGVASFPGPLREFRTASDEHAGPGNEAREGVGVSRKCSSTCLTSDL